MNPPPKLQRLPRAPGRQIDNVIAWLAILFGGSGISLSVRWYRGTARALIAVPDRRLQVQQLAGALRVYVHRCKHAGVAPEIVAATAQKHIEVLTRPWGVEL